MKEKTIAIAWREDLTGMSYEAINRTVIAAGAKCVVMKQVKSTDIPYDETGHMLPECKVEGCMLNSKYADLVKEYTYHHSNAEEVWNDLKPDAVIFSGGPDISPNLYKEPVQWHGIEEDKKFNPDRDVNDYILLRYCLDHDIPVMGICRGIQLLSVVCGGKIIEDIPTYFKEIGVEYNNEHRRPPRPDGKDQGYASHPIEIIDKDSIFYDVFKAERMEKCPSWHHQCVGDISGTPLKPVAVAEVNGVKTIEVLEYPGKRFVLGTQVHTEVGYVMETDNLPEKDTYMNGTDGLKLFKRLVEIA